VKRLAGERFDAERRGLAFGKTAMSDSSTFTCTCIRVRSAAMRKSTGDVTDAASVCPTSTSRSTTIPSIGDRMIV